MELLVDQHIVFLSTPPILKQIGFRIYLFLFLHIILRNKLEREIHLVLCWLLQFFDHFLVVDLAKTSQMGALRVEDQHTGQFLFHLLVLEVP